jgi:hypothetical protein
MAAVRCPICGTVNPDGGRRLARCASCHEALRKCRYCIHYDSRLLDCTHVSRATDDRILDADEVLNCPQFGTRLPSSAPARRVLPIIRTVAIGAVVGLGLMFGLSRLVAPKTPGSTRLQTSVSAPTSMFREDPLEIKVFVHNQADQPAKDVRVALVGRGMRNLTCLAVDPAECFEEATPQRVSAYLGEIAPGDIGTVLFRLSAGSTGKLPIAALVTAATLEVPDQTQMEIVVVP